MEIVVSAILSQNITLVYDALELRSIDTSLLKNLMGDTAAPLLMDTPELIVAVYPLDPVIVQIGDRRIRITLSKPSKSLGAVPLWQLAARCNQMAKKSKLIAYGFNYDVQLTVPDANSNDLVCGFCVSDVQRLEENLGGQLISLTPRVQYTREGVTHDLVIESVTDHQLNVHFNAHFEHPNMALPSASQIEDRFRQQFDYVTSILPKLLEGGKW